MEIESQRQQTGQTSNCEVDNIMREFQKEDFNLKYFLILAKSIREKVSLIDILVKYSQNSSNLTLKVHICNALAQLCSIDDKYNDKSFECLEWILRQIFNIRQKVQQKNESTSQQMSFLNGLLKLIYQILNKANKTAQYQRQGPSLLRQLIIVLSQLELSKQFVSLANIVFSLNVLIKIDTFEEYFDPKHEQIASIYINKIKDLFPSDMRVQDIVINTVTKWVNRYPWLVDLFSQMIYSSSFYAQLSALNKFKMGQHLMGIIEKYQCREYEQFQMITLIVQKYYSSSTQDVRTQLCRFWINNCFSLFQIQGLTSLSCYIADLSEEVLINLVRTANTQLNQQDIPNRQGMLIVWRSLLVQSRLKQYLLNHHNAGMAKDNQTHYQNEFRSIELVLYRFVRQTLGVLPCTLQRPEIYLVLQVYSHYFDLMLTQPQCQSIRKTTIELLISKYNMIIRPVMLLRPGILSIQPYNSHIINLEQYDPDLIDSLLHSIKSKGQTLISSSFYIKKDVTVILIKYVCQKDLFDFKNQINSQQLVEYLIENNIQLHGDKFGYLIAETLSKNIQKYVKIIRNNGHKNIYEHRINAFIIDLLGNQLAQSNNLKLIPVEIHTLLYIVQRLDSLLQIAQQSNWNIKAFANALYCLVIRSLYQHVPDIAYMFLLAVAQLKDNYQIGNSGKESEVVRHLIKFCNQYTSHPSYWLIGHASVLLVIYGDTSIHNTSLNNQLSALLSQNQYFLKKMIDLLSNQVLMSNHSFTMSRKYYQIDREVYTNFWISFRKNMILSIMKNLLNVVYSNQEAYYDEVNSLRKLIYTLMQTENREAAMVVQHSTSDASMMVHKRVLQYDEDKEYLESDPHKLRKHIQEHKNQQKQTNFLDKLLNSYKKCNQFKSYKEMEQDLSRKIGGSILNGDLNNLLKLQRVHDGQVRSIKKVKR